MPGSASHDPDLPDDREAWTLAAQWGSDVETGDPGACLYGFRAGGSPPQSAAHRDACLALIDDELLPRARRRADEGTAAGTTRAEDDDVPDLERLRAWLASWSDEDLVA